VSSNLSNLLLGWVAAYGAPVVGLLLFLGAAGIPLPTSLVVIAGGAFIHQRLLDARWAPLLGFLGALAGDVFMYALGYYASPRVEQRLGSTPAWDRAHSLFNRHGGWAVYLTRWLLSSLAYPTNLLAGSGRYALRKFILADMLGELTWMALYGGLGYVFASQWELVHALLADFSGFALGAAVLAVGVYLLVKAGRSANGARKGNR